MLPTPRPRGTALLAALLIGTLALGSGCFARKSEAPETAPAPPPPEPPPPPPPEPDPGPDPAVLKLEEENNRLELKVLEKESEVQALEQRLASQQTLLDEAIQEVVRAKAKLRSLESRAEAASQMAETEIALKALRDEAGEASVPEMLQIEQMMESSVAEFEKENFGGALYLSSQAKTRIQMAQLKLRAMDQVQTESGEVPFAVPLSLKVTRPSNVREEPSLGAPILITLKQGSPVTGYSHMGDWIRVKLEDGARGWIHQSLLTGR